jgi:hypothetical protein
MCTPLFFIRMFVHSRQSSWSISCDSPYIVHNPQSPWLQFRMTVPIFYSTESPIGLITVLCDSPILHNTESPIVLITVLCESPFIAQYRSPIGLIAVSRDSPYIVHTPQSPWSQFRVTVPILFVHISQSSSSQSRSKVPIMYLLTSRPDYNLVW